MLTCFVAIQDGWMSLFFFFSSRRRHTRFDCDWSSDVCSSDLVEVDVEPDGREADRRVLGHAQRPSEVEIALRSELPAPHRDLEGGGHGPKGHAGAGDRGLKEHVPRTG